MYGWSRPGQGAGPVLPVGGWILVVGRFSGKIFAGVGVTTPRHKCTWVLTIEEMLGFGRVDLIGWLRFFYQWFFI